MDTRAAGRGFVADTIFLIKVALVAVALLAVGFGIWKYNDHQRDIGRAEVQQQWDKDKVARQNAAIADRDKREGEKAVLAKQYQAEKAVREDVQRQLDEERENAIRSSAVAGDQCFDERMREHWNRSSGHAASGPAR